MGLSCYYHNSAAALVADGEVVAAVEEERLSRVKNDSRFPAAAVNSCLEWANVTMDDVDVIAFYEKPHRKLARILSTAVRNYPAGRDYFTAALEKWGNHESGSPAELQQELLDLSPSRGQRASWDRLLFVPHHLSHAASAFYPSPFPDAAVLVVDGVGEFATTTIGVGHATADGGKNLQLIRELRFPHSLGLFYSAFTHFLGFEVNEGEYKLMGLAPYGEPRLRDQILDSVIRTRPDGSFTVNEALLTYATDRKMYDISAMEGLFGSRREADGALTSRHADLAASVQAVTEEILLALAHQAHAATGEQRLVLGGGVALNCVANGRILREGPFSDIWVTPAPGDCGGAVGAALQVWHDHLGRPAAVVRPAHSDGMSSTRLGPAYETGQVHEALQARNLDHRVLSPAEVATTVAGLLAEGKIVGWFQGRMEFGPRALGGRSILADPRPAGMQRALNMSVKRRESFRPFAAAVLRDRVPEWFNLAGRAESALGGPDDGYDSPYMSLVAAILPGRITNSGEQTRRLGGLDLPRNEISACTHVDGTSRIQTVRIEDDWLFYSLLTEFEKLTSVPILLNTSFNRRGEPIVCTPEDAIDCFLDTGIDYLCMENTIAWKTPEAALASGGVY
jgi:carbamoyltransferase